MQHGLRICLLASLVCVAFGRGAAAAELSEQDYFSELPTVLTVSRLAQPLSDTPGAVTIIDRATIRRSGARELVDVLRLVPGYLVGGFNGANPGAAYHAPIDELGARNLVLIDGRSVYSAFYQGNTHRGMMGVLLEDIERIEVLRGSNSAAYGANAMFGVINIITRNTADTHGVDVSVTGGEGGIKDNHARIGWSNELASFRLSAGRRSDSGYGNAHDDKIVSQMHFRGDLRPAADQELMVSAGVAQTSAGDGFPLGSANNEIGGNALRTTYYRDAYLHGQWRKQLSDVDEVKVTANFVEETFRDAFPYALDPSVLISSSGRGRKVNLELQHQIGVRSDLRVVWGAGYKYEEALSPALYAKDEAVSFHEERLFGNIEWRPHPQWLINAGGFLGKNSWTGTYFAPRLMANLHVLPDHTLRAGVTESARMPTLFELAADVRYVFSPTAPFPYALFSSPSNPFRYYAARGNVGTEKLFAKELGYFGNFRNWRLTLDVRGYIEHMDDLIDRNTYPIPPNPSVIDFVNRPGFKTRGFEYQMRWKPFEATEIWINQSIQRLIWDDASQDGKHLPPTHAATIALFQKLPLNLDLSLMFHTMGAMTWRNEDEQLPSRHRVDVRLAKSFLIGSTRAEVAFAVQAANGSSPEFLPSGNFKLERRAYGTLRLEF